MSVPNSVKIPLDCVWTTKEFNDLVKVLGFAAGMVDNAESSEEMKKAYSDVAHMCMFYLKTYEDKQK